MIPFEDIVHALSENLHLDTVATHHYNQPQARFDLEHNATYFGPDPLPNTAILAQAIYFSNSGAGLVHSRTFKDYQMLKRKLIPQMQAENPIIVPYRETQMMSKEEVKQLGDDQLTAYVYQARFSTQQEVALVERNTPLLEQTIQAARQYNISLAKTFPTKIAFSYWLAFKVAQEAQLTPPTAPEALQSLIDSMTKYEQHLGPHSALQVVGIFPQNNAYAQALIQEHVENYATILRLKNEFFVLGTTDQEILKLPQSVIYTFPDDEFKKHLLAGDIKLNDAMVAQTPVFNDQAFLTLAKTYQDHSFDTAQIEELIERSKGLRSTAQLSYEEVIALGQSISLEPNQQQLRQAQIKKLAQCFSQIKEALRYQVFAHRYQESPRQKFSSEDVINNPKGTIEERFAKIAKTPPSLPHHALELLRAFDDKPESISKPATETVSVADYLTSNRGKRK